MPDNATPPTGPFDVKNIHQLVRLMRKYDLTAIDLADGATKIRLRRRGPEAAAAAAAHVVHPMIAAAAPAVPQVASAVESAVSRDVVIESPMVGTYYSSPAPDALPFVAIGSAVRPVTTVCVIEAMKVFTDIPAGLSGTVTEVLVKNGQSVEYGQPMFRVRPA
jgi:acetyl-CoA carboxylase biotin carboxyl carrier protein